MTVAFGAGILLGALGALTLATLVRSMVFQDQQSYCVRCAMHRDHQGNVHSGVLYNMLSTSVGIHSHVWVQTQFVNADARAMRQQMLQDELTDLDALERDPQSIVLLNEAVQNNPERALRFVQTLLNPDDHVDRNALSLLARPSVLWNDRWRIIDSFTEQYHCERAPAHVMCALPLGGQNILLVRRAGSTVSRSVIPLNTWLPQGFVMSPQMVPIPCVVSRTIPIAPVVPSPPPAPIPPPVRRNAVSNAATRRASMDHLDELLLEGRCDEAQRYARRMDPSVRPLLSQHFGSACRSPYSR
jgi:hypothetical protein